MIKLSTVIHDIASNTLEATWVEEIIDAEGNAETRQVKCRNYSAPQKAEFLADTGDEGKQYVDMAGWTDQFVADWIAREQQEAAERNKVVSVTMRQARLALLQAGLLAQVQSAVAGADEATKITWEFSNEVRRDNPICQTLAAALGMGDAQMDALFTLASTL